MSILFSLFTLISACDMFSKHIIIIDSVSVRQLWLLAQLPHVPAVQICCFEL